jgi:F-type H+-transporting ATPase subunit delta
MAEATTIARPYAEAVFRLADQSGNLAAWSSNLEIMAHVAENAEMRQCIGNPKITAGQLGELFLSACGGVGAEARNLVQVMVENRRLAVLPEVRALFEQLKHEREGVLDAEIFSAFPLDAAQKQTVVADLERKLGKRVTASVSIDPDLIGGVKIVVGDQVIDASVRARLAAMELVLKS